LFADDNINNNNKQGRYMLLKISQAIDTVNHAMGKFIAYGTLLMALINLRSA